MLSIFCRFEINQGTNIAAMKKLFVVALLLTITLAGTAQKIETRKKQTRLEGVSVSGTESQVAGTFEQVSTSWNKYLKSLGKTKQQSESVLVTLTAGTTYYGFINRNGETATVFLGKADSTNNNESTETLVRDFVVAFYRTSAQQQVDEALRAQLAVEKQQTRLVNESKMLTLKLEDNKREKAQLEKALALNSTELIELTKRTEQNKTAQDSIKLALDQVKKAVEFKKAALNKIN